MTAMRPEQVGALVVLGCRVTAPLSGAARRRCERATRAWQAGAAASIVISGGRSWHGLIEADAFKRALLDAGLPDAAILCETRSLTTFENAWFTRPLLEALNARRIGLITCDFHMKRARRCFERVGFDVVDFSATTPDRVAGARTRRHFSERGSALLQAPLGWLWDL